MDSVTESDKARKCNCCGERGRIKARAVRGDGLLKLFCHDEAKSCYVYLQGRYFEDD